MITTLVYSTVNNIYYSVADLYIVLYDSIIANPAIGHGREGIYFGVNGEHSLYELGKAVGEALVAIGKSDNPEPTTFSKEEADRYFGGAVVSNHQRFVPEPSLTVLLRGR